jgi:murein DD-endopeptidase MepM/ murein hydrolase activator NlpD
MKIKFKYIFILVFIILIFPINANAKTLGELKNEYNALEEQYNAKNDEIKNNEAQTSATNTRIQSIYSELATAEKEIQNTNNEISKLNEAIEEKDEQIKELMRFFQLSQGENTYLEYIFSAESITDFIYRVSVTEQLSKYNDNLIDEMNNTIIQNKENIEKLHKQEESLKSLQEELKEKLVTLAEEKETLDEEEESIEKDIEYSKKIIDYYLKAGCKENQDIATCANKQLPVDTKFWRPLQSGQMYSTWWTDTLSGGGCRTHAGVDIANSAGTPVYAVAAGKVVIASYSSDGYGNKIVINHNVNGTNYTSLYGHLSGFNVKVGDVVTKDSVIGYVGSTGRSYGNHLHLNICVGIKSCIIRSDTVDPGNYINFPANKVWFRDRTTAFSGYYSNPCSY